MDAMNSVIEDLVKMTRQSLGQKSRNKVREARLDLSELSDTVASSAPTKSPNNFCAPSSCTPSCGVLVLDAAAVQRNFDAINMRMERILEDQEELKRGQSEIRELLRMRSSNF